MKTGSIQLSTNFLVMMILALVVFGLGITFLYNITSQLDEASASLDESTKSQINQVLLTPGMKVAFPKKVVRIARGEKHILGFGVKNTDDSFTKFKVETDCLKAYKSDDTLICNDEVTGKTCSECDGWVINTMTDKIVDVEKRETKVDNLFIKVPGDAVYGEYIFNLEVKKYDGSTTQGAYDTPKRFYVRVT
ncbi:MAG: hypothetical protein ACQESF_04990 [Nanobdellota archaeon]